MSKSLIKVVLLHDFSGKGAAGEIVSFKPGYIKNFLVPKKLVIYANDTNLKNIEVIKAVAFEKAKELKEFNLALAEKISFLQIVLERKSSQDGKIFGAVASSDILRILKNYGVELDKSQVLIKDKIRNIGSYKIKFILSPDVIFEKDIKVVTSINVNDLKIDYEQEVQIEEQFLDQDRLNEDIDD